MILTVWDVADHSWKLFFTFGGLPETISVQIHTGPFGGFRRPAVELSVTVVGPAVVLPFLNLKKYILIKDFHDIELFRYVIHYPLKSLESLHILQSLS